MENNYLFLETVLKYVIGTCQPGRLVSYSLFLMRNKARHSESYGRAGAMEGHSRATAENYNRAVGKGQRFGL